MLDEGRENVNKGTFKVRARGKTWKTSRIKEVVVNVPRLGYSNLLSTSPQFYEGMFYSKRIL